MDGLEREKAPPVVYLTEISFYCQTLGEEEQPLNIYQGRKCFRILTDIYTGLGLEPRKSDIIPGAPNKGPRQARQCPADRALCVYLQPIKH